jgi:hypothetical protein
MNREEALKMLEEKFSELTEQSYVNLRDATRILANREQTYNSLLDDKRVRAEKINAYFDAIETRNKADELINKGIEEVLNVKENN